MKVYEESTLWKYLDWDNDIQRWTVRIDDIDDIPVVDAEPVRHGKWNKYYHSYFGQHQCVCSECEEDEYWKKYYCYGSERYCPNCGAKMDKED